MTLDELIMDLQGLRDKASEDVPIRVVVRRGILGDQYEIIHSELTDGLESKMALVFAGREAAEMDWPATQ